MSKVYVQEKLTAGSNISIQDNVISSVGFAAQPTAPTNTDLIWIDTSDSQDDGFYPVQIDWVSDVGASTSNNPLGWRAGYWADNGSFQTSDEYIGTAVRVRAYSDSTSYTHFLYGVSKVIASLPEGVTVVVKEWNQSDTSVLTNTFNIEDGDFFSVDPNCMYSFAIHTSSENITEAYLNTIKMTMYRATQYREKTTEFERFSVRTNLNWSNISSTTTDNAETENMVIRKGFIALPTGYTALGKPTPVIMLSHGSGGSVTGTQINKNNADNLALIRAFTGAGYAVFDVDNTQANENGWADWGCLPLVSEYVLAWEHIRKTYNVRPEVNIYSMSMGTTAALNIMKWRFFPIKTACMSAPRPLCETIYENSGSAGKTQMATAFGLSGTSWEHDRLKGFNQYENAITIGSSEYIFDPLPELKVLLGQSDTSYQTEARAYVTALQNAGLYVNYREIANATHNDMCFLVPGSLKQEVINWFNRFNEVV